MLVIYLIYNILLDCTKGCSECKNYTSTSCTNCLSDYYWLKYSLECIESCPSLQFYNQTEYDCQGIYSHIYSMYIYIYIYFYIGCHRACDKCSGLGDRKCVTCLTAENYYPIFNESTHCLHFCESTIPLYLDRDTCRLCHDNCLMCYGNSSDECLRCKPPYFLGNQKECIHEDCSTYPNTFPKNYACEDCHYSCNGCLGPPNKCKECAVNFMYHPLTNFCLSKCPFSYYSYYEIQRCQRIYIYIYIYI